MRCWYRRWSLGQIQSDNKSRVRGFNRERSSCSWNWSFGFSTALIWKVRHFHPLQISFTSIIENIDACLSPSMNNNITAPNVITSLMLGRFLSPPAPGLQTCTMFVHYQTCTFLLYSQQLSCSAVITVVIVWKPQKSRKLSEFVHNRFAKAVIESSEEVVLKW